MYKYVSSYFSDFELFPALFTPVRWSFAVLTGLCGFRMAGWHGADLFFGFGAQLALSPIPFNPFRIPQLPLPYVLVLAFLATTTVPTTPGVLQYGVL